MAEQEEGMVRTAAGNLIPVATYQYLTSIGAAPALAASTAGAGGGALAATTPTLLAANPLSAYGAVAPTAGAGAGAGAGILPTIGGGAGIVGAGAASALLSEFAQNKVGEKYGDTTGMGAGILATPLGAQLNMATKALGLGTVGSALNKAFGAGKTSPNIGDRQAYMNQLYAQAEDLRSQALSGKIDQAAYESQAQPLIDEAIMLYHTTAGMGQKPANNIRQNFHQFLTGGFLEQTGPDGYKAYTVADPFGGKVYSGSTELENILSKYKTAGKGKADAARDLNAYANTFQQMFNSAIGRDPTAAEYDQFFGNVVQNDTPWSKPLDQTQLRQETSGLLSQFYSGEAAKEAQRKAEETANAAVAPGSAFDLWSQSYRGSINDVEKSLQDYQSRLFEKLRPQLLTSLKAQGLLDTGGLNQAFAGAAEDLGAESGRYVANARTGIEQDINTQRYGLMSAPTQFKLSNAFNTVPSLTQSGQTALQNVYGNMMNQNMFNQQAALQRDLANQQNQNQPSLLSQYGGLIMGGAAGGFGQGLGRRMGGGY